MSEHLRAQREGGPTIEEFQEQQRAKGFELKPEFSEEDERRGMELLSAVEDGMYALLDEGFSRKEIKTFVSHVIRGMP